MAKLIVIEGPDRGNEYPLPEDAGSAQILGRDPRSQLVLTDGSVSRQHLRIEYTGRDFRLVDLGSRNRSFLNGEPVREVLLRNGDILGVGDTELRFEEDRPAAGEDGAESTILKEIPATGEVGLQGILEAIAVPGAREERLREALGGVRRLLELSRAISRSGSLDELYGELLGILVPALDADRGTVLIREGRSWVARASRQGARQGKDAAGSPGTDISESVVRRAAQEGKAILSAHTRKDARFQDKASVVEGEIVSAIAAPILAVKPSPARAAGEKAPSTGLRSEGKAEALGVLYADRRGAERPFGEPELELLAAAAQEAGKFAARLSEEARLRDENRNLLRSISDSRRLIGRSKGIADVLEFIRRAAPAHQTVLIRGETGTGKELVASAIHYQSPRQGKPFLAINCAAIPETLIESELFGHERGAFTGAVARRKGKFELADGGTVFLDEVAELTPECQAKLLRLLEEKRFERVGGAQLIDVDVRVMAATNKDLTQAIAAGEFREDLFYRLNVLGITLPPLRERKDDIPLLASHFLAELGKGRWTFAPDAAEKLLGYPWPGNIRQLRNVIESAVVMGDGPVIRAADLVLPAESPEAPGRAAAGARKGGEGAAWEPLSLDEVERRHILKMLEHTGGNKKRAAELLGIERCTLYSKLKAISGAPSSPAGEEENGENGIQGGKERKGGSGR